MSNDASEKTLQEQLDELDAILAWFEQADVTIDHALDKFKEGTELAERIQQRLDELQNTVTILKERFDRPA